MSRLSFDLLLLYVIGVTIHTLAAFFVTAPTYMDAQYYFLGGVQLTRGQGFSEPYVWNYLSGLTQLPHPSHLYWMPLASLLIAPFMALSGGNTNAELFRAGQVGLVLASAAVPLLSYWVTIQLGGGWRPARLAALLTLFAPFYFIYWTTTDAFAVFALSAAGALIVAVAPPTPRRLFGAGVLAGAAHLARADGVLVVMVIVMFTGYRLWMGRQGGGRMLLAVGLGYLLVMSPWFIRNLLVVGTPLAPNGLRAAWLTHYNELFNLNPETISLDHYLSWGWANILASKWAALVDNAQTLIAAQGAIVAFPFMLIGAWRHRQQPVVQLAGLYGVSLFVAMTLVFTLPGRQGGYFHSGVALLPFVFPLAVLGLEASVEAVARRLRHWQPEKSKPVFGLLLLAGVALLALSSFASRALAEMAIPVERRGDWQYRQIGLWLAQNCSADCDRVAANNPPGFVYQTGLSSIVIPNGPPEDLAQALQQFEVQWVALDFNHPQGLEALYQQPDSDGRFRLRATFGEASQPVYLLELVR